MHNDILSSIDSAIKAITVTNLGEAVLSTEKFDLFVQQIQETAVVLGEVRFIEMQSQKTDIDRIAFIGRISKAGKTAENTQRVLGDDEHSDPTFGTQTLTAAEFQAIAGLYDTAARRNIEKDRLGDTIIELMSGAAGVDIEEICFLADKDIAYAVDDVLSQTNGWIKNAAHKVYGVESGSALEDEDFDPKDAEDMFDAMLEALPKAYLQDREQYRFYVDFDTEDAYRDALKARGTALGDLAQTTADGLRYKGIPVKHVPVLDRSKAITDGGNGRVALLTHVDNTTYGLFHEVTVEPDRLPKMRRTDFVLTYECDANFENPDAAVAAYIDVAKPE